MNQFNPMDMLNRDGCLVCFSKDNNSIEVRDPELLKNNLLCLHSVLSRESTNRFEATNQHKAVYICKNCYEVGSNLNYMETEMWKLKKQMLDSTIEFNLSVLHSRIESVTQNTANIISTASGIPMRPLYTTKNKQTAVVNYGSYGGSSTFVRSQRNHGSQEQPSTFVRIPVCSEAAKKANQNGQQPGMGQPNGIGITGKNEETNAFECYKCSEKFSTKMELAVHYQFNKGKVVYPCRLCPKVYPYLHIYQRHLLSHSKVKLFRCHLCPKSYKHAISLKSHQRVHTGAAFQCTYCPKSFVERRYLSDHERMHTGNMFQCSYCDKSFVNRQGLAIHTAKHSGKRSQCSYCDKLFVDKYSLRRHQKSHETQTDVPQTQQFGFLQ